MRQLPPGSGSDPRLPQRQIIIDVDATDASATDQKAPKTPSAGTGVSELVSKLRGVQFPATTLNRLILAVVLACVVLGISRNNVTMWSAAILGGLFAVSAVRFFASQRRKWFMFALSGAGVFFWLLFKFA